MGAALYSPLSSVCPRDSEEKYHLLSVIKLFHSRRHICRLRGEEMEQSPKFDTVMFISPSKLYEDQGLN